MCVGRLVRAPRFEPSSVAIGVDLCVWLDWCGHRNLNSRLCVRTKVATHKTTLKRRGSRAQYVEVAFVVVLAVRITRCANIIYAVLTQLDTWRILGSAKNED